MNFCSELKPIQQEHNPEGTHNSQKHPSNLMQMESEKTTAKYESERFRGSMAAEQSTVIQKWADRKNYDRNDKMGEQLTKNSRQEYGLNEQIRRLHQDIQIMKRNHQEQVLFLLKEQLAFSLKLHQLVQSNQYRRLIMFLQNKIVDLQARIQNEDFQNTISNRLKQIQAYSSSICTEKDPQFQQLISCLYSNTQEIGIENLKILPQVVRLKKQTDISVKQLSWYFSNLPFALPSIQNCQNLAQKFVERLGCTEGNYIMDIILKGTQSQKQGQKGLLGQESSMNQKQGLSDSESSLSKIIYRYSQSNL